MPGELPHTIEPYPEPQELVELQDFPSIQPDDGMDFEPRMFNSPGAIILPEFMAQDICESSTQGREQLLDADGFLHPDSSNVPASAPIALRSGLFSPPQNGDRISIEPEHDLWELDIRGEGFLQDVIGQPLVLWGSQWLQNLPLRRLDKQLQREGEKTITKSTIDAD